MRELDFEKTNDYKSGEYPTHWQYLNSYLNSLINNLELYKKVKDKVCNQDELIEWYKMFYTSEKKLNDITDDEIINGYYSYKNYVMNELITNKKFLYSLIDDSRVQFYSLNMTLDRVKDTLTNN